MRCPARRDHCYRRHNQRPRHHLNPQCLPVGSQVGILAFVKDMLVVNSLPSNYHNMFEGHHRLTGWLGLAVSIPRLTFRIDADRK